MRRTAIATAAGMLLLTGCGSTPHARTRRPPTGPAVTVTISGYAFHPSSIAIPAGTRVTFLNRDSTAHTATAAGASPAFDTGTVAPGSARTVALEKPGAYSYYCQFHAFMRATIRVTRNQPRRASA